MVEEVNRTEPSLWQESREAGHVQLSCLPTPRVHIGSYSQRVPEHSLVNSLRCRPEMMSGVVSASHVT